MPCRPIAREPDRFLVPAPFSLTVTGAAVKLEASKRMAIAGRYSQALVANRYARHASSSHLPPFRREPGEDADARACMPS